MPHLHFIVLDGSKLYNTFVEVVESERRPQEMWTNALLASDSTKSADIEQALMYSAHRTTVLIVIVIAKSLPQDQLVKEVHHELQHNIYL
jgi:L-lactate utilization protein LutC